MSFVYPANDLSSNFCFTTILIMNYAAMQPLLEDQASKGRLSEEEASNGLSDIEELKNEMGLVMERNKSMEKELKEMHERYSDMSLKFAEVEGERQQLVMKLRNLKNMSPSKNMFAPVNW